MSTMTRWWWIRHAPVNSGGRIYGQRDMPADCTDLDSFRWLAERLPRQAVWIVTPLQRTRMTALAVQEAMGQASPLEIEDAFIEQSFGDWQGRTYAELDELSDGAWHRFWLAPAELRPPGGESFAELMARVEPAIARRSAAHAGQDIVVVAHGGSIRAAVATALGLTPEKALSLAVANSSLTRIDHIAGAPGSHATDAADSWRLSQLNHGHRKNL